MKLLRLTPHDVLCFRGGRTLERGAVHAADTVFPPLPATVYNAIRTAILAAAGGDFAAFRDGEIPAELRRVAGTPDAPGAMAMSGLFPARQASDRTELHFPAPGDLFEMTGNVSNAGHTTWRILKNHSDTGALLSAQFPIFPLFDDICLKKTVGWLSTSGFRKYLAGKTDFVDGEIIGEGDIVCRDRRVGIGIDAAKNTVREGDFFVSEVLEFRDGWSLAAVVDEIDLLPLDAAIRLGGDGRHVDQARTEFDPASVLSVEEIQKSVRDTGRFKLVVLTPAICANGWKPSCFAGDEMTADIAGTTVRLVSAICNRPQKASGFDMARNRPRPVRNLLPAGSIFHCEFATPPGPADIDRVFERFHWRSISDIDARMGYGLTVIGGVNS